MTEPTLSEQMRELARITRRWVDDPPKGCSRESYMGVLASDIEVRADKVEALDQTKAEWFKRGRFAGLYVQNSCICIFENDGETVTQECSIHAAQSAHIEVLKTALRELLAAYEDQLPSSKWNMTVTGHVAAALEEKLIG